MLDPKFIEILACPYCKHEVREQGDTLVCARPECGLVYTVEDGIPIMLIEEASKPCPQCRAEREFAEESLICRECGTRYAYDPGRASS